MSKGTAQGGTYGDYNNKKIITGPQVSDDAIKILERIVRPLIGPRCKTHDKDDFPDLKDDERCLTCAIYEEVDRAAQQIRQYIDKEIIGPDNYINKLSNNSRYNQQVTSEINGANNLKAEQRRKIA